MVIKKAFFFIVCTSLLVSCSTNKKKDIVLVNDYYFKMMPGESISDNSQDVIDRYEKYFNNDDSIQIPLYKYIKNENYQLFIGLPMESNLMKLQSREMVHDSVLINHSGQNTAYYQYSKDSLLLTHYYAMPDKKNITAVFVLTKSKEMSDSLFSEQKLSERIYQ